MTLSEKVRFINIFYTLRYIVFIYFFFYIIVTLSFDFIVYKIVSVDFSAALSVKDLISKYSLTEFTPLLASCLIVFIVFISKFLFSKVPTSYASIGSNKLIVEINKYFPSNIKLFITPYSTHLSNKGIFISEHDASLIFGDNREVLLFKLNHEKFHYLIKDYWFSKVQSILLLVLSFNFMMLTSSHISDWVVFSYIPDIIIVVFSAYTVWFFNEYYAFAIFRLKECFCDYYAMETIESTNKTLFRGNRASGFKHPSKKTRLNCTFGDRTLVLSAYFSFNLIIPLIIILFLGDSSLKLLVYFSILLELILLFLSANLLYSSDFFYVSKGKSIVYLLISLIVLAANIFYPTPLVEFLLSIIYPIKRFTDLSSSFDNNLYILINILVVLVIILLFLILKKENNNISIVK